MSRINIDDLLKRLESIVNSLNANPADLVPIEVIHNLMDLAIKSEIMENIKYSIIKEVRVMLRQHFKEVKNTLVNQAVQDILTDSIFRKKLENVVKNRILDNIR